MLRSLCVLVTLAVAFEVILQAVCFAEAKGRGKRRRHSCPNACVRKFDDYRKGKVGLPGPPGPQGLQGLSIALPTCKRGEYVTSDGHKLICEKLDLTNLLGKACLSGQIGCLSETNGKTPDEKSNKMIKFMKKNMVQKLDMDSWDAEAFYIGKSLFVGMSQLGRNSFVLYKWLVDEQNPGFKQFQNFDVIQSRNWEPFKINGEQYLVIASFQENTICPIYKWNGKEFVKFQNGLPCSRGFDVEPFELNGVQHIAVTNFDEGRAEKAVVFKWDGSGFTQLQKFDVTAQYVEVFKVKDETYLGISGVLAGPFVMLYKWNGGQFVLQQTLQTTHHPYDLTGLSVNNEVFLAVATYETKQITKTVLFRWNGKAFELYQNISSQEARRVVAISSPMMGKKSGYLAVINYSDKPVIYVWEDEKKFLPLQELDAKHSRDISFFEMGGNVYLILSSQRKMEVFKGEAV